MSDTIDQPSTIIDRVMQDPGSVLEDASLFKTFYSELEKSVLAAPSDVQTEGGRDLIASTAFRVVKARTGIEGARKKKTEAWRKSIDRVNRVGKVYREQLEALQDKVSAPLDQWKTAEAQRETACNETFLFLITARQVGLDATAANVTDLINRIRGINDIVPEVYGDKYADTIAARDETLEILTRSHATLLKSEADAARLQELEAEREAEQKRRDAESRQKAADDMAAARLRDEEARIAQAKIDAAAQATLAAQAEAQRKLDEAERVHKAELEKIAAEKRAEIRAEEERQANERARQANVARQRVVNNAAAAALVGIGLSLIDARKVVSAVVKGEIPAVSINY